MYKIMIVEDEPPLLKDICFEIERNSNEFKVSMEAYNGSEALKKLEQEKPDAIFTDIRMPIMDGLQFIGEIRKNYGNIPIVILSGYQDFKYAQEALKLDVFDYLLKPVDCNELKCILNKLHEKLKEQNSRTYRELLSSALDNYEDILKDIPGNVKFNYYCVFLIYSGTFSDSIIDYTNYMGNFSIKTDIDKILSDYLSHDEACWSFPGNNLKEKVVILCYNSRPYMDVVALAEIIKNSLIKVHQHTINIGLTDPITDITEIGSSLQFLRTLISKGSILGMSKIITRNSLKSMDPKILFSKCTEYSNTFIELIKQNRKSIFKLELKKMFNMCSKDNLSVIELSSLLKHIWYDCQITSHTSNYLTADDSTTSIDEMLSYSSSYEKLYEESLAYFSVFFINDGLERSNEFYIKKVHTYLKENYRNDIDLKALASNYGYTLPYLSRLFRKYYKVSPIEYLIQLKIDKAKYLISSNPDILTKDISDYLGYTDPFYFSRIFKKITGMSPSEYKRKSTD